MPENPFARDFGYLEPFLLKVRAHAEQLADPQARARLAALMDEQVTRWKEIRALLESSATVASGRPAASAPAARRASAPPPGPGAAAPAAASGPSAPPVAGAWTIGSLIQSRR